MEIEMIPFGRIAEFMDSRTLELNDLTDTDGLNAYLQEQFPQLKTMKYRLALNKELVQRNMVISKDSTIAVMPPFSGG